MLNRFKFPTRPGFFSATQSDGEESPPPSMDATKRAPYLSTSRSGVAVLTQLSDDDLDDDKMDCGGDSSGDESGPSGGVVPIPSFKEKPTPKDWLQKRSKREKAKASLKKGYAKKLTKKEKKIALFKQGTYVWSTHDSVSDFAPGDLPQKGKRRKKVKEYGTLMKKSQYYKDSWVVSFDKGIH